MKELKYQNDAQRFLEQRFEAFNGKAYKIYTEEFDSIYDNFLQEASPLIGSSNDFLKNTYGIVGLREKIKEFNLDNIKSFLNKHKLTYSIDSIVDKMFDDFKNKYKNVVDEAQLYQLIFSTSYDTKDSLKRNICLPGIKELLSYNVIYYEGIEYLGKNSFYTIRERRIPISNHDYKSTERPDFVHYINGIPLVLVEYKTEDSGILQSIKDFEYKESYKCAPFKIALNDGRDVIFFSNLNFLKFKSGKDSSFNWVHYGKKEYIGKNQREYTNIEYLFNELLCQPENMYLYCIDASSVVNSNSHYYLLNARIQQYYAVKDIRKTMVDVSKKNTQSKIPYNYLFAHAQRSGKTITMKLICYMIERTFQNLYNTIFMYTPDLQIKEVINSELAKSGNTKIIVKMVETRDEYKKILENLKQDELNNKISSGVTIYIVNMQKITDEQLQQKIPLVINSSKVLNIIDEAHHGQTKETATNRQEMLPNASNYLFTATGKDDMYLFYFPENNKEGFCNKFTISDAQKCKITVPVLFLKAEKLFKLSEKLEPFSQEVEKRLSNKFLQDATVLGLGKEEINVDDFLNFSNPKISIEIKKQVQNQSKFEKIQAITNFLDSVRPGLPFFPKAIVYVNSIEDAKKYIDLIQSLEGQTKNNIFKGYRFGTDFSSINNDNLCETLNPGIKESIQISANFEKERNKENTDNKTIIDVLFAVDKYQKGFDLPSLLVTFLDTNISEPARINQIFTRTATKFNGKTTGYCVDLSLENINQETFAQSMLLYDNQDEVSGSFIDDKVLDELKSILTLEFEKLIKELNLTKKNFTANMVLQQVLNEADLTVRKQRQYNFFNISKNIFSNLGKMGSPLFYKPFSLELKVLSDAFEEFKKIYADKNHIDHSKILINTDNSLNTPYLSIEEIRKTINEVLLFLKENNIKDIISIDYTNNNNEISVGDNVKNAVVQKFSKEIKKNNLEKDFDNLKNYLSKNNSNLYDLITKMLTRISDDRSLIYSDDVQKDIKNIEDQLLIEKQKITNEIIQNYGGNVFAFWSDYEAGTLFKSYGIDQPDFVKYLTKEIYKIMNIILPQVNIDLPIFNKIQKVNFMFKEKTTIKTFSPFLRDFNLMIKEKNMTLSDEFQKQLLNANKLCGEMFFAKKEFFDEYLNKTLKQYFEQKA